MEEIKKRERDSKNEVEIGNLPKHLPLFGDDEEEKSKEGRMVFNSRKDSSAYGFSDIARDLWGKSIVRYPIIIFVILLFFNFWLFRYDDFSDNCHLRIRLSLIEWNNLKIKKSLKYIKEKSPEDYRKVCQYVEEISPDLPCGGSGGGCFHTNKPKQIEVSVLGHRGNSAFTGAIIVHETCHAIQKAEERFDGNVETECYRKAYQFLRQAGLEDADIPPNWVVK